MSKSFKQNKILIAPLDWGLGHATRCIPLINVFLTLNCKVIIAASPVSKALLQTEFPNLEFLNINSYNIVYSRNKRLMPLKILLQFPKVIKAVKQEHKWLIQLLKTQHFDAVISDNRYGFYTSKTKTVFITHQLQIKTSMGIAKNFIRKLTYKFINRFNECWVPDFENDLNIAGTLSHPKTLPSIPVKYLGPFSRFQKSNPQIFFYKYLVIISGPEPQRTIFEQKILNLLDLSNEKFLIVSGKPENATSINEGKNYKAYNHLNTQQLAEAFNQCKYVISRCGYTSVMEILALQKKSILIPTPGQTEQEYLAKHLMKQKWCYTFLQQEDFVKNLKWADAFNYCFPDINSTNYKTIIEEFISGL